MKELLRTNDAVILSYAKALLQAEDIPCFVFDSSMSITEGSLGILPQRLMTRPQHARRARIILRANNLPVTEPDLSAENDGR